MSKRNSVSRFSAVPANVDIQRSKFDRSSSLKTSLNAGKLVPFYVDEVLPGDTFDMKTSYVARMSTPLTPVMDTAFLDMYYFFVPMRLLWDHWKAFNGESESAWYDPDVEYTIPAWDRMREVSYSIDPEPGSVADYMGIPVGNGVDTMNYSFNILPFRAYQLIWNNWFRDQNLQDEVLVNKDDVVSADEWRRFAQKNYILPINKKHDYFTSCLPSPQKGNSVNIDLGGVVPVYSLNRVYDIPESWYDRNGNYFASDTIRFGTSAVGFSPEENDFLSFRDVLGKISYDRNYKDGQEPILDTYAAVDEQTVSSDGGSNADRSMNPVNLYADLRQAACTVNDLRKAFAIQRLFERDARSGTRYREFLKAHFGVTIPDNTVQIPEYLGGECVPLTTNQVVMTANAANKPLGTTGAFSKTVGQNGSFVKSFTEHGYLIGVMGIRTKHTYQQGINKLWSRKSRFDFYLPVLANLGELPVYTKEIYASDDVSVDNVFGYQEAWAEYRYKPSLCTGEMRSGVSNTLDIWHYADNYSERPYLSDEWIRETPLNIDRTLAVSADVAHQVYIDFYFDLQCVRPMPLYSIPGLIDHH